MCSIPGLPTPGSEVPVLISRVNLNPDYGLVQLWVSLYVGGKHGYEQMKAEIQTPKRKFCGSEGKPGDPCLVRIGDAWHRSRIVSVQSDACSVFLIDQGRPHVAACDALAWGQSDSFLLPPEIETCILANVLSLENAKIAKFLKSLPGKSFKGLVQHVLMPDRTVLLDIPTVSRHMWRLGVAKKIPMDEFKCLVLKCLQLAKGDALEVNPVTPEQYLNVSCQMERRDHYFYPELLSHALETVEVSEVIDPQNIFCRLRIFSKAAKILSEQIHQHYEEGADLGEARPQMRGDPCAARGASGRWRRSLLKQNIVTGDGAVRVLHVDEGETELVPLGDVRPLHGKFLRMPVFTYLCSLDGINDSGAGWTPNQTDCLKSLLLNKTVVVMINQHNISQDVYHVTLYSESATCINDYFLEKAGLLLPSKTGQLSNAQNEPAHRSSFLSSLGHEQRAGSRKKDALPSAKNLQVNGREDDVSSCGPNAVRTTEGSGCSDPPPDSDGLLSKCCPSEMLGAHQDDAFSVGSTVPVTVSCIESPQKFWCQAAGSDAPLRLLMEGLQHHYSSAHPQPLLESICVARNPDDGMWYRAKIVTGIQCPVVEVRFVDYGQRRRVSLREVRPIDPAFLRLRAQAFQCCLSNLENPTHSADITAEFQKFVDSAASSDAGLKCTVKARAADEEGLLLNMVELEASHGSASELLAPERAQAGAGVPPPVSSDACNYSAHNTEVGGNEKVWVTASESVNHFYCQLERNSHLFDRVSETVEQLACQTQRADGALGLGGICLARHLDNQWRRGQVVEMSAKPKVHFVDYGDTLEVNECDVRPYPANASVAGSVPVLAVPLGLLDVPTEVPPEVNQWFADLAVGRPFTVSVVAEGDRGKLIVELFDGSQNVNLMVRERVAKMEGQKVTGLVQQAPQKFPDSSERAGVPEEDILTEELMSMSISTKMTEQNDSNDAKCAGDEHEMSSQAKALVALPEEHGKTLGEAGETPLDVTPKNETVLAETFIQSSHTESETPQLQPPAFLKGPGSSYTYRNPNVPQNEAEEVYASCIVGPHYFWCQPANTEILNMVTSHAQEAGQPQHGAMFSMTLDPGSPCLALFSSDNQWYRAQVISRTNNTLQVVFIDYGNESEVDIEDVRALPESLLEQAPQAFLCSLSGFDESGGSWDDEVYDDFFHLLVDKPLRVTACSVEGQSTISVPQYAVKMELDGVVVNGLMQKYWKPFSLEHGKKEMVQSGSCPQGIQSKSHVKHLKENVATSLYKKPDISKHETEEVYASCLVGPHFFWCQYNNTEVLGKMSRLAQEAGRMEQELMFPETLVPGSPCLALFSSDNQWYRALVVGREEAKVHVVFIDYGNETDVEIKNVRSLPPSLLEQTPQAFLCSLNGFDESRGSWDDGVYDDFYSLLVDKPLRVTSLSNTEDHSDIAVPRYAVEIECEGVLVNTAMQKYWKPVAKQRITKQNSQPESSPQDAQTEPSVALTNSQEASVNTCTYKQPEISKNKTEMVYASCIAEPKFFWCQHANAEELCRVSRLVQEAARTEQDLMLPEDLGPGRPCLALFSSDNQWYRAQVASRTDDAFQVVFVDYGNESEVGLKDVRAIPRSLLEQAPQAFLCSLSGFDESKGSWSDEAYDDFYNLLVDKPLEVSVIDVEDRSEFMVPQYMVEIECAGVLVNAVMEKYWSRHAGSDKPRSERA